MQLDSERVSLRELSVEDVTERYVSWLNDPLINRYLEVRHVPQTLESTRTFVQTLSECAIDYLFGIFVDDNDHIGNIRLGPIDNLYSRAFIGLMIGEVKCQGLGYGSEAISIACRWAFEKLKLHKVEAGCYASNVGSLRAFEKVGFTREGRLRHHWRLDGKPEDQICLGLIETEFYQ